MSSEEPSGRRLTLRERHDRHLEMRRQRRRGGDGKLDRDAIAAAAVAIADAQGFDAVSMRKIAAVLGSGTMSLYHYIRTKDDLMALMDDAIMGEVLVPDGALPSAWRDAMTMIATRTRETFARHPWSLTALLRAPPGRKGMRHFEQSLAALAQTNLAPEKKFELISLVDDYVFGHALRTLESARGSQLESAEFDAFANFTLGELKQGIYPEIAKLMGDDPAAALRNPPPSLDPATRFQSGLQALLDGAAIRFGLTEPDRSP